jgi:NADH-quinone oxidoreductase subunit N
VNLHELVSKLIIDTKGSATGSEVTLDSSLRAFSPELILCATALVMLLVRVFRGGDKIPTFLLALIGSIGALVAAITLQSSQTIERMELFTGMLVLDQFTNYVRILLLLFLVLFIAFTKLSGIPENEEAPDIYTLVFGATLGMCMMASANHLMMVFMAVEMASVPSYALAGQLKGRRQASEAALKYSVYGAGAAGVMLYGISLIAGLLNTAHIPTMAKAIADRWPNFQDGDLWVLAFAGLMIGVGLAFKLSAVPFHFWAPDVFEGATAEVNAFLSVASKAAALALLVRVVIGLGMPAPVAWQPGERTVLAAKAKAGKLQADEAAEAETAKVIGANTPGLMNIADEPATEASSSSDVPAPAAADSAPATREAIVASLAGVRSFSAQLIALIAAITCTFGNLAAYAQTNIKRLLAYSTIAHAGYMMMAVVAAVAVAGVNPDSATGAIAALCVYLATYVFMNLGVFVVVAFLRNAIRSEEIDDYRGLIKRCPLTVVCFAVMLFALVGLPPLSGFIGKFHVFGALVDAYAQCSKAGISSGYLLALLVVGGLNTAISLFYYVRVVKVMTMDEEPRDRRPFVMPELSLSGAFTALVTLPTVGLILCWEVILRPCQIAAHQLFFNR